MPFNNGEQSKGLFLGGKKHQILLKKAGPKLIREADQRLSRCDWGSCRWSQVVGRIGVSQDNNNNDFWTFAKSNRIKLENQV